METKYCVDCKYKGWMRDIGYCTHPSNVKVNNVTGRIEYKNYIYSEREYGCFGNNFVEKESLFIRILNWIKGM